MLSAGDSKDAAPLADLLGEYLARCLYSRTWQLREAALAGLAQDLEAGSLQGLDGSSGTRQCWELLPTCQWGSRDVCELCYWHHTSADFSIVTLLLHCMTHCPPVLPQTHSRR